MSAAHTQQVYGDYDSDELKAAEAKFRNARCKSSGALAFLQPLFGSIPSLQTSNALMPR